MNEKINTKSLDVVAPVVPVVEPAKTPEQIAEEERIVLEAAEAGKTPEQKAAEQAEKEKQSVDEKKNHDARRHPEILRRNAILETENRIYKEMIEKGVQMPQGTPDQPHVRPNRNDFQSAEDYTTAVMEHTEWLNAQMDAKLTARDTGTAKAAWNTELIEAEKNIPDFKEVTENSDVRIPKGSVESAIVKSKVGAEILYRLGKNPEIAQSWEGKSDEEIILSIGELAATIKSEKAAKKLLPKESRAPAPITPIVPSGSREKFDVFSPKVTASDIVRHIKQERMNKALNKG